MNDDSNSDVEDLLEVHRDGDGELVGFVARENQKFLALTVFLVQIGSFEELEKATEFVNNYGLAALNCKWFGFIEDEWQLVVITEASPERVEVSTDVFGVGDGFKISFLGGTDKLRLADSLTPLL